MSQLGMTPREAQIVEGFASGRSTDKLAQELYISSATLRTHLRKIFSTLNVGSRVEMIALVLDRVLQDVEGFDPAAQPPAAPSSTTSLGPPTDRSR